MSATNSNAANEVPPEITTAHLFLRGLLPSYLGCSIINPQPSQFQMTYRKDLSKLGGVENGGLTGKLSWNMGKKFGSEICSLSLPRDDDDCDDVTSATREEVVEKFWSGLESAANRLISESDSSSTSDGGGATMKIIKFDSEDEALSKLGNGIMDAGQLASREKRIKKEKKKAVEGGSGDNSSSSEQVVGSTTAVSVGQIIQQKNDNDNGGDEELFALSMLHGHNLIPLSQLGQIKILRSNPRNESNIVCNVEYNVWM